MIARKSFIIMVANTICGILGLLVILIISKLWGDFAADALGVIGFSMAFVGMFSFISDLGFGTAHIKRVSEGKDLGTCIGTYITIKLVLTTIMILVVVLGIAIWKHVLHQGFYDSTKETIIYIFLGYYVFLNLAQIPIYTFNAKTEIAKTQISSLTETFTRVPLMIIVALAGVSGAYIGVNAVNGYLFIPPKYAWPNLLEPLQIFLANHAIGSLAMTYFLGNLAALIIALVMFRGYPVKRPTLEYAKSYFAFAMPMALASILAGISINLDKVIIGFFWTSTEVGYYFAVQRITTTILMFSTAVSFLLFPTISSLHSEKNIKEIKAITWKSERYMSLFTFPLIIFLFVFSSEIINLFLSGSFLPASQTLQILAISTLFATIRVPYICLLSGMNKINVCVKIAIVESIINIALNFLLIPSDGLLSSFGIAGHNGAAVSMLITTVITLALYSFATRKILRMKLIRKSIVSHMVGGSIMGLVLYYTATLFDSVRYYHLLFLALVGLGIYISILWSLKEFRKRDYRMVIDAIGPKGIFHYFKSELKNKQG